MGLAEQLAGKIKLARSRRGISQVKLSERVDVAQGDISRLENGRGNPTINTLRRLPDALDCEVDIRFVPSETEA